MAEHCPFRDFRVRALTEGWEGRGMRPLARGIFLTGLAISMLVLLSYAPQAQDDPVSHLRSHERTIREDMVGALDAAIGTPAAAQQQLAGMGWRETDRLSSYAFWWSNYWTAAIGVGLASGASDVVQAPRNHFLDHANATKRLAAEAEAGSFPDAALLATIDAGMEKLKVQFVSTRAGLLDCYGMRLGAILGRSRAVDTLLRSYQTLPEEIGDDERNAALRTYREAQRDLETATWEALQTCVGEVAIALRDPAFPLSSAPARQEVGDDADDACAKLDLAIARLEGDLARAKNSIERQIPASIKLSEQQIARAEAAIAMLDLRIAPEVAQLKTLKGEQTKLASAIGRVKTEIADLRDLQRQLSASLPEGARIFAAFAILKAAGGLEGASDQEKLDFYNRVSGRREVKLPPKGELEGTHRRKRIQAEMRVAWTAGKLSEVAMLFSRKPENVIGNGILFYWQRYLEGWKPDTPGFLDDPTLRGRIEAAPRLFQITGGKFTELLEQLQAGTDRIEALRASGATASEINEVAGGLVPVASQLLVEAADFERNLQTLLANLGKAQAKLAASIAMQQQKIAELQAEKADLASSVAYEKDELLPALKRQLDSEKDRAAELEKDLERLRAQKARDCAR